MHTELYKRLGVTPTATKSELKKAYFDLAKKYHPDKGGDPEKFKEIDEAYKVLKDDQSRRIYDQTGQSGQSAAASAHEESAFNFMRDIFESMPFNPMDPFNQMNGRGGKPRTQDTIHQIQVPLETLYSGATKTFSVKRKVLCKACDAKGAPDATQCTQCNGNGRIRTQQMNGPFIMNTEMPCGPCREKGFIYKGPPCKSCNGLVTDTSNEKVSIDIPPNAPDGHAIVLAGMSDEKRGHETGNLVFVIREKPHETFMRRGDNLFMKLPVPLVTALVGGTIRIRHLSGELLEVPMPRGKVISHGTLQHVPGEGMPRQGSPDIHGDLVLEVNLVMPSDDWANTVDEKALRSLLPSD